MLKLITFLISLLCCSSTVAIAVEYKQGWDYMNFYQAVQNCRESVIYPQIKAYEAKGIKNNHDPKELQNEMISITPVFDSISTNTCFCMLNEIAKDNTYPNYKEGIDFESYSNIPRCKKILEESFKSMPTRAKKLQLD